MFGILTTLMVVAIIIMVWPLIAGIVGFILSNVFVVIAALMIVAIIEGRKSKRNNQDRQDSNN